MRLPTGPPFRTLYPSPNWLRMALQGYGVREPVKRYSPIARVRGLDQESGNSPPYQIANPWGPWQGAIGRGEPGSGYNQFWGATGGGSPGSYGNRPPQSGGWEWNGSELIPS